MAQILHKRATTTHAIRAELQRSKESVATLSKRYNLNPKTVRKWRARHSVEDAPMGPSHPHSTSMTLSQEAAAIAFRKKTLLPLDDCLHALQHVIPGLTRSSLHRLYNVMGLAAYQHLISLFALKLPLNVTPWGICISTSPKCVRQKGKPTYLLPLIG